MGIERTCEVCGNSLEGKYPQAKTCGERCRWKKNWRTRVGAKPKEEGCSYESADKIVQLLLNDYHAIDRWKKLIQMEEV